VDYKFTRHQVARGSRPDAEKFNRMYLIKNVGVLRATYQIRLLAYLAVTKGMTLVLRVPKACKFDRTLEDLKQDCGKSIMRENA
jgi:hypothetical protein